MYNGANPGGRASATAVLLRSRVRISPGAWLFLVLCLLCVVQVAASATG